MKHRLIFGIVLIAGVMEAATAQSLAPLTRPPRADIRPQDRSPAALSADDVAKVRTVLAAYRPASLQIDDAKAIKRGFRDAGLQSGRALDAAISAAGFSPERLEALDPRPIRPPGGFPPR